jgi:L-alanine-DL-glutamate epimerase-like enolase superfamily enzyme
MELRLFHVSIPLRRVFEIAGQRVHKRDVVLVGLTDTKFTGWGEAAPFPGQDEPIDDVFASAGGQAPTPTLAAAIDEANADLAARKFRRPLVEMSVSQPPSVAIGLDQPVDTVDEAVAGGVLRFKVKIAPGRIDHIKEIRARHPDIVIGVDGNASFTAAQIDQLGALADCNISYAEELFDDWNKPGARTFGDRTGIPLFADESLRSLEDARVLLLNEAVSGLTLKPGRLGWEGAQMAARLAENGGKLWRASGLLETGIGRAFTNALASQPEAFVSDISPATQFLVEDVISSETSGSGLGVVPDMTIVERYLVNSVEMNLSGWEDQDLG